jgi:hypothetical protein
MFNMDKTYSTRTHMVVCTLEKETNTSRLKKEVKEVLGPEYLYLNVIVTLIYLANNTRPDIIFLVNYLARHNAAPTMCHWNDIKNIL